MEGCSVSVTSTTDWGFFSECVVDNHCHCHADQIGKCSQDNQARHHCICQGITTFYFF